MNLSYASARKRMIENQLRTWDVNNERILQAFEQTPRELFFAESDASILYSDSALPIKGSVAALAPLVLGRLIQALNILPGEKVLNIASGNGYSTALLSALGADVTTLETDQTLVDAASKNLTAAGLTAAIKSGAAEAGLKQAAPFDVILINGAILSEPATLLAQLSATGRLGTIFGEGRSAQARIYRKSGNSASAAILFEAAAPVLSGFTPAKSFSF